MAHSPKEALLAAKEDLLAAYSAVHSSLGRLINLVHNSEPRAIADALGSEYVPHSQSPPQNHYPIGQAGYGHRSAQPIEPARYSHTTSLYPAPSQTQSSTHARTNPPPGPSFMTAIPGAPHQLNYAPMQSQKPRQRKLQPLPPNHSYASQPVQPLETDEEEEEEDDPEEPISDDDHNPNRPASAYYNPPTQSMLIPTPPGSIPGGKKKKVKRERDPNAPKRPASAYILFQNAVRQEMRAANPTADYKELARQIGDRWKNLSEEAKRPWSEAGKLAMNSWNIQNKEYKTSHPEITSPHNQSNGTHIPGAIKRRSRAVEVDELGQRLPKKRGRPSKGDKDPSHEHQSHSAHFGGPQTLQSRDDMQVDSTNAHHMASVHHSSVHGAQRHSQAIHGAASQTNGVEYSEEDEVEDDDEEEEEDAMDSHAQGASTSFQQTNGATQNSSHMAPTDSDMDEVEDDEGSAVSTNEPVSHTSTNSRTQANGISA